MATSSVEADQSAPQGKTVFLVIYTAQNKYVCTRLFALFGVLNWSLIKKVYIILKLVQFPIQRSI